MVSIISNPSAAVAMRILRSINSNPAPSNGPPLSSNHLPVGNPPPTTGQTSTRSISDSPDAAAYWNTSSSPANSANAVNGENDSTYFKEVVATSDVGPLVDTNLEEEAARLKALQTRQQLAAQALNISGNSRSNIMALFQA